LQQLGRPLRDPERRLVRFLAGFAREPIRIVDQNEVDVGRVIEFLATELAHGDSSKAGNFGIRRALGNRRRDRTSDRPIGERRKLRRDPLQRHRAGKVGNCEGERERAPFPSHRNSGVLLSAFNARGLEGGLKLASSQLFRDVRKAFQLKAKEGRMVASTRQRVVNSAFTLCLIHTT
jgi:hypothetical protein